MSINEIMLIGIASNVVIIFYYLIRDKAWKFSSLGDCLAKVADSKKNMDKDEKRESRIFLKSLPDEVVIFSLVVIAICPYLLISIKILKFFAIIDNKKV